MDWSAPSAELSIADGDVHIWRAFLDPDDASFQVSDASLSEDERARAARLVFPRDRDRFTAARGILRAIAGRYLRQPAALVEFSYEPQGKPRLSLRKSDPPLCFNVSHSQGLAVYAFTLGREVGVDVEAIRSDVDREGVAERVFSAAELAEYRSLPLEQRDEGFFCGWTRKEAYVKALGGGLSIPLHTFSVSLTPGMPETRASADSTRWSVRSFRPSAGYVGAVVAEGKDWRLHFWDWVSERP